MVKKAAEATEVYDAAQLSAIVAVHAEEMAAMTKDLRDARQRIRELEEQATRP